MANADEDPPTPRTSAASVREAARRALKVLDGREPDEQHAVSAVWPDAIAALPAAERERRVRKGADTLLLDDVDERGARHTRGFVRVVLRVPVGREDGAVYGVFVEVDRDGYSTLQQAYKTRTAARVWGTLANRLPLLEDAFETRVLVEEDGSDRRARVVEAEHEVLRAGPEIGPGF